MAAKEQTQEAMSRAIFDLLLKVKCLLQNGDKGCPHQVLCRAFSVMKWNQTELVLNDCTSLFLVCIWRMDRKSIVKGASYTKLCWLSSIFL